MGDSDRKLRASADERRSLIVDDGSALAVLR
jgi:hypothetical protein